MKAAEGLAIVPKAVVERTMVVSSLEGLETEESARSTILIWMICPGMQVRGTRALMHRTKYCLPQAAPLSHIPSPAAPNRLLDGNWSASLPKHAVAVCIYIYDHNPRKRGKKSEMMVCLIRFWMEVIFGAMNINSVCSTYANMGVCSEQLCRHQRGRHRRCVLGAIEIGIETQDLA